MKFTEDDLAAELAERFPPLQERKPGGVTVAEMADIWGVGYRQASYRLRELEGKGLLVSEVVRGDSGRGVTVFYRKV